MSALHAMWHCHTVSATTQHVARGKRSCSQSLAHRLRRTHKFQGRDSAQLATGNWQLATESDSVPSRDWSRVSHEERPENQHKQNRARQQNVPSARNKLTA